MRRLMIPILTVAVLGPLAVTSAGAEEAKAAINAATILNIMSQPADSRASAFDQSLREPGPRPASSAIGQLIDEGTVRYGNTTITVKNPCPPGTAHYEPPPLPGRRAR
jgi:hypothetical protein